MPIPCRAGSSLAVPAGVLQLLLTVALHRLHPFGHTSDGNSMKSKVFAHVQTCDIAVPCQDREPVVGRGTEVAQCRVASHDVLGQLLLLSALQRQGYVTRCPPYATRLSKLAEASDAAHFTASARSLQEK